MVSLLKDTPWAEYAPEAAGAYPIYSARYDCADIVGRIRPGMTMDQAKDYYDKTGSSSDPKLKEDFDSAKLNSEDPESFRPSALISREKTYVLDVYQEYACLTAEEFFRICSMTPTQARVPPIEIAYMPKNNKPFFLPSLEGLTCGQIASVRKCKISYIDGARSSSIFLRPEDQLLADQGMYVMPYVLGAHMSDRPEALQGSKVLGDKIPSLQDLLKRKADDEAGEAARLAAAAEKIEKDANRDPFDEIFSDEESAGGEAAPAQHRKQRPGLSGTAPPLQAPRLKSQKATAPKSLAGSTSSTRATDAAPLGDADESAKKPASTSNKKIQVSDLDPEMQTVAMKHLSSDKGSSINSLYNFNVEFFLVESEEGQKRYPQAAKLKGVRIPVHTRKP